MDAVQLGEGRCMEKVGLIGWRTKGGVLGDSAQCIVLGFIQNGLQPE